MDGWTPISYLQCFRFEIHFHLQKFDSGFGTRNGIRAPTSSSLFLCVGVPVWPSDWSAAMPLTGSTPLRTCEMCPLLSVGHRRFFKRQQMGNCDVASGSAHMVMAASPRWWWHASGTDFSSGWGNTGIWLDEMLNLLNRSASGGGGANERRKKKSQKLIKQESQKRKSDALQSLSLSPVFADLISSVFFLIFFLILEEKHKNTTEVGETAIIGHSSWGLLSHSQQADGQTRSMVDDLLRSVFMANSQEEQKSRNLRV